MGGIALGQRSSSRSCSTRNGYNSDGKTGHGRRRRVSSISRKGMDRMDDRERSTGALCACPAGKLHEPDCPILLALQPIRDADGSSSVSSDIARNGVRQRITHSMEIMFRVRPGSLRRVLKREGFSEDAIADAISDAVLQALDDAGCLAQYRLTVELSLSPKSTGQVAIAKRPGK